MSCDLMVPPDLTLAAAGEKGEKGPPLCTVAVSDDLSSAMASWISFTTSGMHGRFRGSVSMHRTAASAIFQMDCTSWYPPPEMMEGSMMASMSPLS